MTLRHVVLLRFVEGTSPEARRAVVDGLRQLPDLIEEIERYDVGIDAGLDGATHDVAVVAEFADRDAYRRYQRDPRHVAVLEERIRPILAERASVQIDQIDQIEH